MRPRFSFGGYFINVEKTKHIDDLQSNALERNILNRDYLNEGPLSQRNWPWPDFTPSELACGHCGQFYDWPYFMDRLQVARSNVGRPFKILSGHRCSLHNARVGGAPLSQHLKLAADISTHGHNRCLLFQACKNAGFTGFGFYQNFLHIDLGRPRKWWSGEKAKDLWQI